MVFPGSQVQLRQWIPGDPTERVRRWPGWDRWPIEIDGLPGLPFLIAWWIFPWRTVNVISPDGEYM